MKTYKITFQDSDHNDLYVRTSKFHSLMQACEYASSIVFMNSDDSFYYEVEEVEENMTKK